MTMTLTLLLERTDLPAEVRKELEDPKYIRRTHGRRKTYQTGCHGPLCRKIEREYMRIRTARKAHRKGKMYKPIMILRQAMAPEHSEEVLAEIMKVHYMEREVARKLQPMFIPKNVTDLDVTEEITSRAS